MKSCKYRKKKRNAKTRRRGGSKSRDLYKKKQQENDSRINEIFSEKQLLVAEYSGDKIIIKRYPTYGDLLALNYEEYVSSGGKHTVVKYDFTKESFLKKINDGTLEILDETI
jgi:hypothetical protein